MTWTERLRDSADPLDIPADWPNAVGGYLHTGDPAEPWSPVDWRRFPHNRKLPIVAMSRTAGRDPVADAFEVALELFELGVPKGSFTALDLELTVDPPYVRRYGDTMHWLGYKTWPYGSASTLFGNPQLNGYWVADWAGQGPFMHDHEGVRATQYASPSTGSGGPWDSSAVRDWVWHDASWWR